MKKAVILVFVACLLVVVAYVGGLAWERLCLPRNDISVSINGQIESYASAYTCPNGLVIVQIPNQTSVLLNLKDLSHSSLPTTQFHNILGIVFANDPKPVGVNLSDRVKIETPLNVIVSERTIGFDDFSSRERIQISIEK